MPAIAINMNPRFEIYINDHIVNDNLMGLVRSVEYESTDNMADMAKIVFSNPNFVLSELKELQPGNEVFIWFGYGHKLAPIGRVEIARHHSTYPRGGMPTIEIIGYTADRRMMDHAPAKSKRDKTSQDKATGASFEGKRYSDVVKDKADAYNFQQVLADKTPTIDDTKGLPKDFFQKFGMSDYDFIRGMANITGSFFWVDGAHSTNPDRPGAWTLHFKQPDSKDYVQRKRYTFMYNNGDQSTLLEFRPQLLTHGQKTTVKAQYMDKDKGEMVQIEFPEQAPAPAPDVVAEPSPTYAGKIISRDKFKEDHTSGVAIKLLINEYSFEAIAPRDVNDAESLRIWAEQWYKNQRDDFVMAEGTAVGLEYLMARQIHNIKGLHGGLDGLYYFSRVRHSLDSSKGYEVDFNVRKVIDE